MGLPGEAVAEAHGAARRRHVEVLVLHRRHDVEAELKGVVARAARTACSRNSN